MANPARQKGTAWETALLPLLRKRFGKQVERSPASRESCDFVGTPFPVEAKNCITPRFQAWVRKLRHVASENLQPDRWVLIWKGDARRADGRPLAVIDLEFFWDLVAIAYGPFGHAADPEKPSVWLAKSVPYPPATMPTTTVSDERLRLAAEEALCG